jgi:hypothetical protein
MEHTDMALDHTPITIRRTFQGLELTYIDDEGRYHHVHYIDYTREEALEAFDSYLTDLGVSLAVG